ncbi:MAG: prolipoprotein diacylglyceryl transferase [bacterium]
MYPKLFQIGPFTIYGYGLMLATGFIVGSYILAKELHRRGFKAEIANTLTLICLIAGIVGSKMLFLLENWSAFIASPLSMAFNPAGLTYFGGFVLATATIYVYSKRQQLGFLLLGDAIAPSLILAYGIGRLGCHLAGDGDYGFPTTLPWGTDYSRGTVPPSYAFRSFPEIANQYPGGIVPNSTPLHPTPVYEFLIALLIFVLLWRLRKSFRPDGKLFMLYLVFAGLERFAIEFMRLNERTALGFTEAQLISFGMTIIGVFGWILLSRKNTTLSG